jgi:hypothetical protein
LTPCFAGIENWCVANGPSDEKEIRAGPGYRLTWKPGVHLAKENPRWGYDKIQGELLKPEYNLRAFSVRNILKRHRLTPASERSYGSWRSFLGHDKDQILACDFFTVETVYVIFFIELGTRRVHLAVYTTTPDTLGSWHIRQCAARAQSGPSPV